MGIAYNPRTVTDGLVLTLDGANYKSFKGEVTTNLIPNPTVNAYPTTGNAWGTYNTNQYNAGSFFSIGSISSVSSNIITTSTNHPLRTYDVVRPQTTGGGVVQNFDYFVKKLSDTTFTLHAYNSSQDGSQGYINSSTGNHKVYDSLSSPLSVSIGGGKNPSFPTMWWGAPHLPNSGLVKELRYGEFNAIPNLPANDCIRLHYIRTDDVKDGMSYNVDCTVTPSSPVTISFYTRAANANAVGKVIQYYIYNYVSTPTGTSAQSYAWNFTLGALGVWERQTFTYTPAYGTMISYWFPQSSGVYSWDWSCMQVEQKSYVTNFVAGTRGSTVATGGGWADLSGRGNNGELVNGVRESSDNLGALVFDGTNDRVELGFSSTLDISASITIEGFIYPTAYKTTGGYGGMLITKVASYYTELDYSGKIRAYYYGLNSPGYHTSNSTVPLNTWTHYAVVRDSDSSSIVFYINGSLDRTITSITGSITVQQTYPVTLGSYNGGGYEYTGRIASGKIYNRALTASEIQQNFNASRGRFGI
jgi:hypothetical protein